MPTNNEQRSGLRILSLSVHGLVRTRNIELGRDPDTGGQITYVIEQARALASHPEVRQVDLFTRQVLGANVDDVYSETSEPIAPGAVLRRVPCGPRRYLRKESLWAYLDEFVDGVLQVLRAQGESPDVVHGHYADAGYIGSQLARVLGVPFVFTGHSLGREKRRRLLDGGGDPDSLDKQYRFPRRIEAEELALETASLVIASTHQEVEQQYGRYDQYEPYRMEVIPPGVDLSRFRPPEKGDAHPAIADVIDRFLVDPDKPMVLALARPDERKNLAMLVRAFGEHPTLREQANLVVLAGTRDDIREMGGQPRRVLTDILVEIDRQDLYGHVAYPKTHESEDVPQLYRLATRRQGVFVNPALTEPFGLTLIEAAATGLPLVATNDGGPRDIIGACENGVLVDPLDSGEIAAAIDDILGDADRWEQLSTNGIRGAREEYAWSRHAERYVNEIQRVMLGARSGAESTAAAPSRMPAIDRLLLVPIDGVLLGDEEALAELRHRLDEAESVAWGVVTGRRPDDAMDLLQKNGMAAPDLMICCAGSEITYGSNLAADRSWLRHIDHQWLPGEINRVLSKMDGLTHQSEHEQRRFKISFTVDTEVAPSLREIRRALRHRGLRANLLFTEDAFLDVLPLRCSPGRALRFLTHKWGLDQGRVLVVGRSWAEEDLLSGQALGVLVGDHAPGMESLREGARIHLTEATQARAVLEALEHYHFLEEIQVPPMASEAVASAAAEESP